MRNHGRLALVSAAALALASAHVATRADGKVDPRTYSAKSKVFGRTFPQWAAEWLQWSQSIPASASPMLDETGERASVAQQGPVWFLVGTQNVSGVAHRVVKIPAGKALFIPVINVWGWNNENDPAPSTEAQYRAGLSDYLAAVDLSSLHVTLDDAEIQGVAKMRVAGRFDDLTMPADNVAAATGQSVPGGAHGPGLIDGYWVMLKPLRVGRHTLRSQGTVGPPNNYSVDVTYDITVIDHSFPPAGN